ncbi:hypothetical protein HAV21_20245 [Paenarthrobacter sp. MSM-2-10-13]|uniref:hypothetical protein n=1 Tax=Paenarthrobacter sp. MSM-2-10-13 TaxID=2717318 RepID=UPI001423003F|nr:hypothetical protein [Paenarthrobacter sp. MSM-2-10-13]NHW49195.1 hypothetical protein [Paenarthrobacter sp. MSM-2-10-13]
MGRIWSYVWRIAVALLALWLVGLKAAQQVKWIGPDPWLEFVLVVGAGVLVFADNIHAVVQLYKRPGEEKRRRKIEKTLLACVRALGENSVALDTFSLGASVYVYRRRGWFSSNRPMKRIRRYRLTEYPQESIISWSDSKGVVGKAARSGLPQHADWTKVSPRWNTTETSAVEAYNHLSQDDRWGFTFDEFRQVASKYVEALAVPILNQNGGKVLGVLSIDVPFQGGGQEYSCSLDSDAAKRIATVCAMGLREVIDGG